MPYALSIGVSYDTFWHLNPTKLRAFTKAYEFRQQQRSNEMWLMGQHVAAAMDATVCNIMPFVKRRKKGKYPDAPIRVTPMTEEEKREKEEVQLQKFFVFTRGLEKKWSEDKN